MLRQIGSPSTPERSRRCWSSRRRLDTPVIEYPHHSSAGGGRLSSVFPTTATARRASLWKSKPTPRGCAGPRNWSSSFRNPRPPPDRARRQAVDLPKGEIPHADPAWHGSIYAGEGRGLSRPAGAGVSAVLKASATSGWRAYSTVTLFARLRGWSASFPMTTAV